jgi:RadC-like JAB domain
MTRQFDLPGLSDSAVDLVGALNDVDLLAAILGSTKTVAQSLIREFGSLPETIAAPASRLAAHGLDRSATTRLKAVQASIVRVLRGEIAKRPVLTSWSTVLDYLRAAMAFGDREQFRILFLDKRNMLIADEVQQVGTVDHVPVYPREVMRRALEVHGNAAIARSISPASCTLTGITSIPSDGATAWIAPNWPIPWGMAGSRRTAARITRGAISLSSSSHFAPIAYSTTCANPVALPPGRAKLATHPAPTGSGV